MVVLSRRPIAGRDIGLVGALVRLSRRVGVHLQRPQVFAVACTVAAALARVRYDFAELWVAVPVVTRSHIVRFTCTR
jgi:hypothetical protein